MPAEHDSNSGRSYDRVASFYETSARLFSLGRIPASKAAGVSRIRPGDRVAFLGAGSGEEVARAIRAGADVTCLDLSQKMLDRLQARLRKSGLSATTVCENAFTWQPEQLFDVVCANYFFNLFRHSELTQILDRSVALLRPGGRLVIADVAPATGNPLYRAANVAYLKSAMVLYWCMGLVSLHRTYDYTTFFPDAGLAVERIDSFRLFPGGPVVFRTITATAGATSAR